MKLNNKLGLLVMLIILLVTLSCLGDSVKKDRKWCEEQGGFWHDEVKPSWCDFTSLTKSFVVASHDTPAGNTSSVLTAPVISFTPTFDISQCDARSGIEVVITLSSDVIKDDTRSCWYQLKVTNISEQGITVYLFANKDNNNHSDFDEWTLLNLLPEEDQVITALGLYWMSDDNWNYIYIERAAAVYRNDTCRERIDYDNIAETAEQFAWDVENIFCQS